MKKIITLILCTFIFNISNAQTTQHVVDSLFQYINKSPITSNIFIDRVFATSGIQEFNQGSSIDTSSFIHFKQTWSDLNRASYIQNFSTIEQFKSTLKNKNYNKSTIPIGVINTEFHQSNIGTNTSNANVTYSNGFMRDKAGKIPFIKKQATVIAPLVTSARGSQITFTLDADFILHKFGKSIKNLVVLTNNTSITLINNYNLTANTQTVTYTSSGLKTLQFNITFSDNSTKTTYGNVKVFVPNTYSYKGVVSELDTIFADNSDLLYQGYDENTAYQGQNEYRIYYDNINNNQIINKPIFIIDGYDPGDIRKIETYDPGHDSEKSIRQLMKYKLNGDPTDLIDELRDDGYDVIIVNHHKYTNNGKDIDGGSDYIQRNAFTLISLLRHINATKQGNEPNVVIGPSMGGLITRYALAYMEKKLAETGDNAKWNHETRLWVSFDSPHQGANIPLGVQKGIQYYAEVIENEGAKDFIEQLNQPAPSQMLVYHYSNFPRNRPNARQDLRNSFQNELDNLGMPKNLRKIALINGSIMGSLNGISKARYLNITSVPFLFVAFTGADIKVLTDFYHSSNDKNNVSNEIFFGRTKIKYNVLGLFTITKTFGKNKKFLYASNKGSYDISPGSYFNAQQQLAQESSGIDLAGLVITNSNIIDSTHSFIPTKSALAYTGSNVLDEVIGNKDRVCTGETPFDSYFAPQENEEHIFLTTKNVAWLKAELEGNPKPATVYKTLDSSSLTGSLAVCDNTANTYVLDIPNSCSGLTVTWSVSNNIEIISTTNNSISVRPQFGTTEPFGHINAFVQEKNLNLNKVVWVGIPGPDFLHISKVGSYQFYSNQWTKLKVVHPLPPIELMNNDPSYGLTYHWSVPNSQIRTFTDTSTIDVNPFNSGQLNIGVKMENQCGCTNYKYQLFNVTSQSNGNPGNGGILRPVGPN